jgi:hypothetical protein
MPQPGEPIFPGSTRKRGCFSARTLGIYKITSKMHAEYVPLEIMLVRKPLCGVERGVRFALPWPHPPKTRETRIKSPRRARI